MMTWKQRIESPLEKPSEKTLMEAELGDFLSFSQAVDKQDAEPSCKKMACDPMAAAALGTLEEEAMRFFGRADGGDEASTEKRGAADEPPLEEQLRNALALAEEQRKNHLSTVAEMQNIRKRQDRDNQLNRQFAIESFARDLLLVADNLERALAAMPKESSTESQAIQDGVLMIQSELNRAFAKHGVTRIEALNTPFDPHIHQAVVHVEKAESQPGNVIQEMQPGYMLNGRLLRPAMVGVAKEPEHEEKK